MAMKAIASAILRSLTQSIITWIQGGEPNFIGNLESYLRNELDFRAGQFLNNLAGVNLCGNIGVYLQLHLGGRPRGLSQQLGCTLTNIVDNVNHFFGDFRYGGWPAFLRVGLDPRANPFGAWIIAYDAKLQAEASIASKIHNEFIAGNGFLGLKKCEEITIDNPDDLKEVTIVDDETGEPTTITIPATRTECTATTPGKLVSDMLSKSVGIDLDSVVNAHEIEEAINAIFTALVGRMISGIFN